MRVRLVSRAVERHLARVEADADPGLAEAGAQVLFTRHEIDGPGLRAVGENEIQERVFGGFLPGFCHFVERPSLELLELRFLGGCDENAGSSSTIVKEVLPIRVILREFL